MRKLSLLTAGCLLLTVGAVASPAPVESLDVEPVVTLSELGYADIAADTLVERAPLLTPTVDGAATLMKPQLVNEIPDNCVQVNLNPCVMVCTPGGLQLCEDF